MNINMGLPELQVAFQFDQEFMQAMQMLVEQTTRACQVMADSTIAAWEVLASSAIEIMHQCGWYSEAELEEAYIAYARWYNWRHPCRKISWRRLNRRQRAEAMRRLVTER